MTLHFFIYFQDGRTPLHYASAMCGLPGSDSSCFDILIDKGAGEHQVDLEGYTAENYRRMPRLIDLRQIQGLNRCSGFYFFENMYGLLHNFFNIFRSNGSWRSI